MTPKSTAPEYVINGFGILGGSSLENWQYTSHISRFSDDLAVVKGKTTLHQTNHFGSARQFQFTIRFTAF